MASLSRMLPRNRFCVLKLLGVSGLVTICFVLARSLVYEEDVLHYGVEAESLERHGRSTHRTTSIQNAATAHSGSTLRTGANPHPFRVLFSPKRLCNSTEGELLAIIYIHSKTDHFHTRLVIRNTWANMTLFSQYIRVLFVLGTMPERHGIQDDLRREAERYDDIIQEDFVDSYKNLTFKAIGALKWVSTKCMCAKYVIKVDDDVIVDTFTLIRVLNGLLSFGAAPERHQIWCRVWNRMRVQRQGKWRVEPSEFRSDVYPTYCSGMAFVMTLQTARLLYLTSYETPFFWVDDVYLTGILAKKLNIELIDLHYYFALQPEHLIQEKHRISYGRSSPIFAHSNRLLIYNNIALWNYIVDLEKNVISKLTPPWYDTRPTSSHPDQFLNHHPVSVAARTLTSTEMAGSMVNYRQTHELTNEDGHVSMSKKNYDK